VAAGLLLGPAAALAQEAPPSGSTNTPATDAVGPRELQNFSLQGNVTRPADQPEQRAASSPAQSSRSRQAADVPQTRQEPARRSEQASTGPARVAAPPSRRVAQAAEPIAVPPSSSTPSPTPASAPTFEPAPASAATGTLAPEHGYSFLPWLLAAVVLGVGGAFLFWRNRSRPAYAGGPQVDLFRAPDPAPPPAPRPAPAPPPPPRAEAPPPPKSVGVVSTSLRPWIDINAQPLRCIVTDASVTLEFELELYNSGSAPARDILVEAVIVNAGPDQDQELAGFFTRPPGEGSRIDLIQPLSRTAFTTQIVAPREQVRAFDAGGRRVFVPLLAFNAFYRRSSGEAQSSAAYLVGRDTKSGKMAPFRLDQGARIFRGLGARLLPNGVRK
jgi:hypothetical protein